MLHALLQAVWTEMYFGSVCTQWPYNEKKIKIDPVFYLFYLLISLPLSQIEPISVWRHTDRGPSHDSLIDSSVSAQTALVSYLRLGLQQLIDKINYENHRQRFSLSISRVRPQCTSNFSRLLKLQLWITHFYGQNASKNSGGNRMRCHGISKWSKLTKTW